MTHEEKERRTRLVLAAARTYRQANGSMSIAEAARKWGVSPSSVYKRLHPEKARAWAQQNNAKRHATKLRWAEENRPSCPSCGAPMTGGSSACRRCYIEERKAERDGLRRIIEEMWSEGATRADIAEAVGQSPGYVTQLLAEFRSEGANLPYRRPDNLAADRLGALYAGRDRAREGR